MERRQWLAPLPVAVLLACALAAPCVAERSASIAGTASVGTGSIERSASPAPVDRLLEPAAAELARARARQTAAEAAVARARRMRDAVAVAAVLLLLGGGMGWWLVSRRRDAGARLALEREVARRSHELEQAHERRRELQLEIDRQRRLEAIGRLTGGVAHDYNNLMTIVRQCCDLLLLRPGVLADAQAIALVNESGRAASAAGEISQNLLAFARQRPIECAPFVLGAHLEAIQSLLVRAAGADRTFELVVPDAELRVQVDPGQLTSVLINLVVNARDATQAGGRITVAATRRDLRDAVAASAVLVPGRYVAIAVRDDGAGMHPEVVERAIEPFYTTKGPAGGTGLGLSIAHGFATQAGGELQIASGVGAGTTVTLLLPETPDGR